MSFDLKKIQKKQTQKEQVQEAVEILKEGGVVGMPTETVYGLGASIQSSSGIENIFKTKKRPFFDPLIVHIADLKQLKEVVSEFEELPQFLATEFWPGPLTMVLPKSLKIDTKITSGLETVGVRFPKHPVAQTLIRELGAPIAAPSANLFGKTSPTRADHVRAEFNNEVFVLEGGDSEIGLESTVIGFSKDYKEVFIYRPGFITQEMLKEALLKFQEQVKRWFNFEVEEFHGEEKKSTKKKGYEPQSEKFQELLNKNPLETGLVEGCLEQSGEDDFRNNMPSWMKENKEAKPKDSFIGSYYSKETPSRQERQKQIDHFDKISKIKISETSSESSPGTLEFHYMPEIPVILLGEELSNSKLDKASSGHMLFNSLNEELKNKIKKELNLKSLNPIELTLDGDPLIVARNLYHDLRILSKGEENVILVLKTKEKSQGLWSAIWNRLEKASSIKLL